jgi:hypothetical protein
VIIYDVARYACEFQHRLRSSAPVSVRVKRACAIVGLLAAALDRPALEGYTIGSG